MVYVGTLGLLWFLYEVPERVGFFGLPVGCIEVWWCPFVSEAAICLRVRGPRFEAAACYLT